MIINIYINKFLLAYKYKILIHLIKDKFKLKYIIKYFKKIKIIIM